MTRKSRDTRFVGKSANKGDTDGRPALKMVLLGLLAICFSTFSLQAGSIFTWSGSSIIGEDPGYLTSGSALFEISGSTLSLTLTNTTTQTSTSIGQVLTILTWDITDGGVMLTPITALIGGGSSLIGVDASAATDLSGEWGFKDNLLAGSTGLGPIGSFGISAVGDVNFGADTFGKWDRFDIGSNLFGPPSGSLNGIGGGIIGEVDLSLDGYTSQGPVVQDQMVFTFGITGGTLTYDEITNVQPLFGSDGAAAVPEPSTLILLSFGLLAGAVFRRRFGE